MIKKNKFSFYTQSRFSILFRFTGMFKWFVMGIFIPLFLSCELFTNPHQQNTSIKIIDPQREYLPVARGEKLKIEFPVKNTGTSLLVIEDVLPSCSCIQSSFPTSIPPNQYRKISLIYHSKNDNGKVGYHTTLLTNTKQKSREVYFQTHVRPKSFQSQNGKNSYRSMK